MSRSEQGAGSSVKDTRALSFSGMVATSFQGLSNGLMVATKSFQGFPNDVMAHNLRAAPGNLSRSSIPKPPAALALPWHVS